jgi:hypothetical protein
MKILALVLALLFSGCSVIDSLKGKVLEKTGNDLKRTSEMAERYGKPEVKVCADFLVDRIGKLNADEGNLQGLLNEETEGIFSAALKAVLVKEYIASLNDPARQEAFRKDFDVACKSVAGQIVLNVARDAAKALKRGN